MSSVRPVRLPILAYHNIGVPSELGITTVVPRVFRRQMSFLAEAGYRSLHPDQLLHAPATWPAKAVLLTFDDGYAGVYEHAYPILQTCGFIGIVFVIAGYIGRSSSWDVPLHWKRKRHLNGGELRELSDAGWCIAAHGWSHRFLTHTRDLETELRTAREVIEDHIGRKVDYLAYPYGSWNESLIPQVAAAGYRAAFTYDPCPHRGDPYAIPRVGVFLFDTLSSFRAKLGERGSMAFAWECFKHRFIHAFTYANLLHPKYW